MPLIIPANTLSDSGYNISNSLRFNYPDNPRLTFTPSSDGNKRTATASFWLKRGVSRASNDLHIMSSQADASNIFNIRIRSSGNSDVFQIGSSVSGSSSNGFMYKTTGGASFRDHSAWYHFVVAIDVTQSSGSNGVKLYVNGVLETVYSMSSYNQNVDVNFNKSGQAMKIGVKADDTEAWDGYMSDFYWIDGTQKQASDFGEYNDNGVWIPKEYDGSYGTNGFFLEMKQSGTGTNASGIGADTSGNNNHFAVSNLTATDVTTDSPTNNWCTFNPLSNLSGPTLSEGNTEMAHDSGNDASVFGTFGVSNGKWYWELKGIETDQSSVQKWTPGVIGAEDHTAYSNRDGGYAPKATALYLGNSNVYQNNSSVSSAYFTATQNDIIQIALDADNNKIYFGKNGTYGNSGDPTSGATGTGAVSLTASHAPFIPHFGEGTGHEIKVQANFGNAPFSISSGNADANGYGNFEYAVPSGYYSLCTKNLAEYG